MDTLHLLDPAARDFVQKFPSYDPSLQTLAEYRQIVLDAYTRRAPPQHLRREERTIPGRAGAPDVRVLLYWPPTVDGKLPALIHLHGGGFFFGSADMVASESRAVSDEHGALVVAVDYRLAPETSFPGPLEDCYAGLTWLVRNADALGVDVDRIGVMGGSAGGGLAASLSLLTRDRAEHTLKAQMLIYPMLDSRTGTPEAPSNNATTGEFVWTRETNQIGWAAMRGDTPIAPERIGHFSLALAGDLSRLPDTFIAVGALDLLLEESVAYALRLSRAGVPVEAHVYPGAPHGFRSMPGALGEQLTGDIRAALKRFFAVSS